VVVVFLRVGFDVAAAFFAHTYICSPTRRL
jgi:hypothetical protein